MFMYFAINQINNALVVFVHNSYSYLREKTNAQG